MTQHERRNRVGEVWSHKVSSHGSEFIGVIVESDTSELSGHHHALIIGVVAKHPYSRELEGCISLWYESNLGWERDLLFVRLA